MFTANGNDEYVKQKLLISQELLFYFTICNRLVIDFIPK